MPSALDELIEGLLRIQVPNHEPEHTDSPDATMNNVLGQLQGLHFRTQEPAYAQPPYHTANMQRSIPQTPQDRPRPVNSNGAPISTYCVDRMFHAPTHDSARTYSSGSNTSMLHSTPQTPQNRPRPVNTNGAPVSAYRVDRMSPVPNHNPTPTQSPNYATDMLPFIPRISQGMPQSVNPNGAPISAYCLGMSHRNAAPRENDTNPQDDDEVRDGMRRARLYGRLIMKAEKKRMQERNDRRRDLAWKIVCLAVGVLVGAGLVTVLNRGIW